MILSEYIHHIEKVFQKKCRRPKSKKECPEKQIKVLRTTATTILALMPILTSTGRGADVMIPMAIPSFGGMVFAISTTFVVPILYSMVREREIKNQ